MPLLVLEVMADLPPPEFLLLELLGTSRAEPALLAAFFMSLIS
jgi:hypothetical protein